MYFCPSCGRLYRTGSPGIRWVHCPECHTPMEVDD